MPHKDKEDQKRKRGKDKQFDRYKRNGGFSQKHIRIIKEIKNKESIKNN